MREHLPFVVGRAAGVDVAVADGRLERRADPFVQRIGRLHVVVAVDQHDRLAGDGGGFGVNQRMAGRGDRFGLEAERSELRSDPLGGARVRRQADRR